MPPLRALPTPLLFTLAALTLAAWVQSYWGTNPRLIPFTDWPCQLQQGALVVQTGLPTARVRIAPDGPLHTFFWTGWTCRKATIIIGPTTAHVYAFPLWMPLLLFAASGLLCRRLLSPHPRGCCQACGYDLRASPGRCPECGRAAFSLASLLQLGSFRPRASTRPATTLPLRTV